MFPPHVVLKNQEYAEPNGQRIKALKPYFKNCTMNMLEGYHI